MAADISPDHAVRRLRERASQYAELSDMVSMFNQTRPTMFSKATERLSIEVSLESTKTIVVDVGLGIFLEMTLEEAREFALRQSRRLSAEADQAEQMYAQRTAEDAALRKVAALAARLT
jgi:prefoldin subunit 5